MLYETTPHSYSFECSVKDQPHPESNSRTHLWAAVQYEAGDLPALLRQLCQPRVAAAVAAEQTQAVQLPAFCC